MNWAQLGYAVAGVIGLALVGRWMRLAESRIANEAQARAAAEAALAGFVAHAALVGTDGAAALVGGSGALAILQRHGARIAARRLAAPLRLTQAVEGVRVDTGERPFGGVLLFGVTDAEVRALETSAARARDVVVTLH